MRTMATASEIATATARKLLVERHALQGRLSKVMQEKVDVKAIWAGCGNRAIALKVPAHSRTPALQFPLPLHSCLRLSHASRLFAAGKPSKICNTIDR